MLQPRLLRHLTVDAARHPRGQAHLSSASGLALARHHLYIVADDENHLARRDMRDAEACTLDLIQFASASLPSDPSERKAAKPDLETLIVFPAEGGGNALLVAWGSASRPQREFAYVFALDSEGRITSPADKVSLSGLCAPLRKLHGELNFEAGFIQGEQLHLFLRAHKGRLVNSHIAFDAKAMRAWLCGAAANAPQAIDLQDIDLGPVDGVPLGITDAAALPDGGWLFSAVAENTDDAYLDGACVGSVIGRMDARHQLVDMQRLHGDPKVEGIALVAPDRLWLVTDADDPARASELLELHWPTA